MSDNVNTQTLIAAKQLLSDPKHWIKGDLAKNESGAVVDPMASDAICWCMNGAMIKVTESNNLARIIQEMDAQDYLYKAIPVPYVSSYNDADETTHQDIMNVFDKAIELSRKEKSHATD
jgi:hypothetical protein